MKSGSFESFRGKIYQKSNPMVTLASFSGSWTKNFLIGGQLYWDLQHMQPSRVIYPKNALPSDSRFREDIYHMYLNNLEKAGEWKEILEARARRDRNLRETAAKNKLPN
jgi:hypothetical protein